MEQNNLENTIAKKTNVWNGLFKTLILAIFAGACIGIGGAVYLSCESKVVGSFLFSIGLLTIVVQGFPLFTGRVGYVVTDPKSALKLIPTFIGNFVGAWGVAFLLNQTRLTLAIEKVCAVKLGDNLLSIFILSIFCGIMMFLAVDNYKKSKSLILVIMPVMVFILAGFEHSIANIFYFAMGNTLNGKGLLYILTMAVGNATGSVIFALSQKVLKWRE